MVAVLEMVAAGFPLPVGGEIERSAIYPVLVAIAQNARLDTEEKSRQKFSRSQKRREESPKEKRVRKVLQRQESRANHAALLDLFQHMLEGQHGIAALKLAEKWLHQVKACPGFTYRHEPCGQLKFVPYSCRFTLCTHCQRRRANQYRHILGLLMDEGYIQDPKFLTFTLPNLQDLTRSHVSAVGKAMTKLLTWVSMSQVRGGIRGIEVTHRGNRGWNLHGHMLADTPWIAHYPQTDIEWNGRAWKVVKKHSGLARDWAKVCQNYPELRRGPWVVKRKVVAPQQDVDWVDGRPAPGQFYEGPAWDIDPFDLDNPDHWYLVDIRRADRRSAVEIAKYVTKGSDVISAGADAVVEFCEAFKSARTIQPFGHLYKLKVDLKTGQISWPGSQSEEEECAIEDVGDFANELGLQGAFLDPEPVQLEETEEDLNPEQPPPEQLAFSGMCPWPDCSDRESTAYRKVSYWVPESDLGIDLEWDGETRCYRVVVGANLLEESRAGPE